MLTISFQFQTWPEKAIQNMDIQFKSAKLPFTLTEVEDKGILTFGQPCTTLRLFYSVWLGFNILFDLKLTLKYNTYSVVLTYIPRLPNHQICCDTSFYVIKNPL